MIDELQMKCKYSKSGCPEVFKVGVLKDHEAKCDMFPISCPNQGCEEILCRSLMAGHSPTCMFKTEICEKGCMKVLKKNELGGHNCISSLVGEIKMMKGTQEVMKDQVEEQKFQI
jgi:hypothetical protein